MAFRRLTKIDVENLALDLKDYLSGDLVSINAAACSDGATSYYLYIEAQSRGMIDPLIARLDCANTFALRQDIQTTLDIYKAECEDGGCTDVLLERFTMESIADVILDALAEMDYWEMAM